MKSPQHFVENFHVTVAQFNMLYDMVKEKLSPKRNTRPHDHIAPRLKLAIVLE